MSEVCPHTQYNLTRYCLITDISESPITLHTVTNTHP